MEERSKICREASRLKRQREEAQRERDEWESWTKEAKQMEECRRQLAKPQLADWQRQQKEEGDRRQAAKKAKEALQAIVYLETITVED